jgi:hypothetical protein
MLIHSLLPNILRTEINKIDEIAFAITVIEHFVYQFIEIIIVIRNEYQYFAFRMMF